MRPYLSRLSFWLAGVAAAISLLMPGRPGGLLASVAMLALVAALWLRRFNLPAADSPGAEGAMPEYDDVAMLELATLLIRQTAGVPSLAVAFDAVRTLLQHELGAAGVRLHADDLRGVSGLVADALRTDRPALGAGGGFAVPIARDGRIVAVASVSDLTLSVLPAALGRFLELLRAQLESVAARETATSRTVATPTLPPPGPPADSARDDARDDPSDDPRDDAKGDPSDLVPNAVDEVHRMAEAIEHIPCGVFVFEPDELRLLAVNRHAEAEFRLRRESLIGHRLADTFDGPLAAVVVQAMREAIREHRIVDCECEWDAHRGQTKQTKVRSQVVRRADGSPRMVVALAYDVTSERRTQARLESAQARMETFAQTIDECLFVTDPDRRFIEILAGDNADLWGAPWDDEGRQLSLVLPEDRHLFDTRRRSELRLELADVSFRVQHPMKGVRWLRTRTRAVARPDGRLLVYGVLTDVSEDRARKTALEDALGQAEAASQAKSQFMANMSHEIRTPMNGILGMTELLLSTTLSDKQRRFAKAVFRSGESLLEIINDILDFSKIEAGKLELAPTDFSLRTVVEDTLELLAPRAHEKGIELNFHELPGLPPHVHGDPLRLRQILTNLVANAIKFTERGEVVVELRLDDSPAAGIEQKIRFEVRDTGIGIAPEVLPRLFGAFTQAQGGMSRRYGGTGLGLAISRQLIELMGGGIDVRSELGAGSQFVFVLPFLEARSGTGPGDAIESDLIDLGPLRVLVVEDHETNRTIIENMLGAWDMAVTSVADGQAALELLRAMARQPGATFDLALVDMRMPGLDGLEFALARSREGLQPHMKLIMLSSVSSPDDARAAQLAGYDRFVAKPIRRLELRQAIAGVSTGLREPHRQAPRLNGSVLVIEDNAVNQEVIGQMLRQYGLQTRVATSALQGLRALCEAHFDLVLMDIQMPGMDGVEALGLFRRGSDDRFAFVTPVATPVVAVTANALGGDEERYLSAGFDDYLSKPFRQSQLFAMLTKHLSPSVAVASAPAGDRPAAGGRPHAAPTDPVLDAAALERLHELDPRGENKLIARIVKAFESSAARLVPQMNEGFRNGDLAIVRHVAHTLKSSSASIGAIKLSHMCAEVETMIRTERVESLENRVDSMCAEIEIVLQALHRLDGGTT